MSRRVAIIAAVVLAACGDNTAAPPDAPPPIVCSATFAGNFADGSQGSDDCAMLQPSATTPGDLELVLDVPSTVLGAALGVTIDLGAAPAVGAYSSELPLMWNALAIHDVPTGACVIAAGSMATPAGSYALQLSALDPATGVVHGTLALELYVLAETTEQGMQSECGAGFAETAALTF
jgi:hypothetical protein